jgi:hypothetical protein
MYDKPSFYLKTFLIASFSAILAIGSFYLFLVAAFSNTNFMGGTLRESTLEDQFKFYASVIGLLISFLICPLFGVFSMKEIIGVTKNDINASILFTFVCFLPVVLTVIFSTALSLVFRI